MSAEKLTNKAIVLETQGDLAKVCMVTEDACESCSSLFCNPKANNDNVFEAFNRVNAHKGDRVTVEIDGSSLFKASFILYVIPMIILVAVIIGSISLFANTKNIELLSFLSAIGLIGTYFFALSIYGKSKPPSKNLPEIISLEGKVARFSKEMKN